LEEILVLIAAEVALLLLERLIAWLGPQIKQVLSAV
jgi:hypothetical protein